MTPTLGEEIRDVKEVRTVKSTSRLLQACPFIDGNGLLRVGGRLQHAGLPFDTRHPIILPRDHRVTRLIARRCHSELGYASAHGTLLALSDNFLIPAAQRHHLPKKNKEVRLHFHLSLHSCRALANRPFIRHGFFPFGLLLFS